MNRVSFERPVKKREERKKQLWKEKMRRRRLSAKKAEARRIAMERSKKRGKEKRQRAREDRVDGEGGSDGWGIDILGYLWPKPNLEEKKSSQRRLWIEERADIASDRIFVSDDETYEFYGFNTTYLDKG